MEGESLVQLESSLLDMKVELARLKLLKRDETKILDQKVHELQRQKDKDQNQIEEKKNAEKVIKN